MSRRGWLLFAALGVIWGAPYLLIRIAVRDIAPPTLVFFRTAPAGLILLPFVARRTSVAILRAHWRVVLAFAVVELAVPWLLLSRAEQRLTSSIAGLLVATVPLIAALLSWITRHEAAIGWQRLAGLGIGFVGVAVLVGIDVHGSSLIAVGEVMIVAFGYALGPLIVSRYLSGVPVLVVLTASLILTSVVYAPIALTDLPRHVSPEEITSVVILTCICTDLAFVVFFALIAEIGPTRATVITYVNPAVAVLLGVALLHEHFSLGVALGFPLILIGSVLGTNGLRRRSTRAANAQDEGDGLPAVTDGVI